MKETRGVTAETAVLLARYFGGDPHSWMNLQSEYDLKTLDKDVIAKAKKIEPRAA